MSIESSMVKESSSSKKKHKSSLSEKKRKRANEEDSSSQKKSRKHRSGKNRKSTEQSTSQELVASTSTPQDSAPSYPFHLQTASLYLPLAPISQQFPLEGLCAEHISPLILSYYPPLRGVILSYSNARISDEEEAIRHAEPQHKETLLKSIDEYAFSWAWVTVDFLLFKPEQGTWLEGYVNLQNEGHLGIVCWNLFNASIEKSRLPRDWRWEGIEGAGREENGEDGNYAEGSIGYYVDGKGNKIKETIRFRIKDVESSHDRERGFLSIAGTMLNEDEEAALLREELANNKDGRQTAERHLRMLRTTQLGVPREQDEDKTQSARER